MPDKKNVMPTGADIRAAFEETRDTHTEAENAAAEKQAQKRQAAPPNLERNTFTMSLIVVLLGLFCLTGIEKGSDTWYVLMLVFAVNAALIVWILVRKIVANRRARREDRRNTME